MKPLILLVVSQAILIVTSFAQEVGYGGLGKKVFSPKEIEQIALAVARTEFLFKNMSRTHESYCRDSVGLWSDSSFDLGESWRERVYGELSWFGFDESVMDISSRELQQFNLWRDRFRIFLCEEHGWSRDISDKGTDAIQEVSITSHPASRVVAVDFTGTFFYLDGFAHNDFRQLIRSHIGFTKSPGDALNAALLYLFTVEGLWFTGEEFVDSTNYQKFARRYGNISRPSVIEADGYFQVNISTVDEPEGPSKEYTVNIYPDGQVSLSSRR